MKSLFKFLSVLLLTLTCQGTPITTTLSVNGSDINFVYDLRPNGYIKTDAIWKNKVVRHDEMFLGWKEYRTNVVFSIESKINQTNEWATFFYVVYLKKESAIVVFDKNKEVMTISPCNLVKMKIITSTPISFRMNRLVLEK